MTPRDAALDQLRRAEWLRTPELGGVLDVLDGGLGRTRVVGGLVRDTLSGRTIESNDIDLATELEPGEVIARAEANGIQTYPTGLSHGTVTLRLGSVTFETTTLREDVETDGRHASVRFGTDWVRDAERRDFTLNALYASGEGGLFDPLNGLDDCLAGRVVFIGDPERRLAEDLLRVYRFFRFSASHGGERLDPAGLAACTRSAGELGGLSPERVGAEMVRMLALPRVAATLGAMVDAAVLNMPLDSEALTRYEQLAASPSVAGRLALMLTTVNSKQLQALWRLPNQLLARASEALAAAKLLTSGETYAALYGHPQVLPDALPVAAVMGGWADQRFLTVQQDIDAIAVPPFPVGGSDLLALGMAPGAALGRELERLKATWVASRFTLGKSELLELLRRPPAG